MIDNLYSASGVKLEVTHTMNKLLMVNSNIGNSAAAKVLQQTTDLLTIDEPALAGRTRVQATKVANNAATSILIVGENAVWDYYRNKNDEK